MQQDDRIFAYVGACVVAAAAVVAALMWLGTGITVDAPQRAEVVVPEESAPSPAASEVTPVSAREGQAEDDSEDALVRRAVARVSANPQLAAFLVTDGLLTRFVMMVDAVAGGYSPRDQMESIRPHRPFLVRESDGRLVAAAGSHHRYDFAAEVVDSIDVEGAVALYRRFQPRLEAIYREVGWSGEDFDTRMREAFDHLLDIEDVAGPFDLEQRVLVYAYADDRVEQLSDAQKQLLRMGPDNVRRVTSKLHELRRGLGWPAREPDDDGVSPTGEALDRNAPITTAAESTEGLRLVLGDRDGANAAP